MQTVRVVHRMRDVLYVVIEIVEFLGFEIEVLASLRDSYAYISSVSDSRASR
jgi:hypothetical protein